MKKEHFTYKLNKGKVTIHVKRGDRTLTATFRVYNNNGKRIWVSETTIKKTLFPKLYNKKYDELNKYERKLALIDVLKLDFSDFYEQVQEVHSVLFDQ